MECDQEKGEMELAHKLHRHSIHARSDRYLETEDKIEELEDCVGGVQADPSRPGTYMTRKRTERQLREQGQARRTRARGGHIGAEKLVYDPGVGRIPLKDRPIT